LNSEGIYTFKEMAAVSLERYKEILKANNMSKFRDPSGWAGIAAELASKK
jgi:predicted flap endonuclease-1-like 5' DNA nuclease